MSKRANNEGTIYRRRSDGRWVGAVLLPDGGRKAAYGCTAEEARDKLRHAQRRLEESVLPGPDRLTVGQWLDWWLEETAVHRTRPLTFRAYQQIVRLHLVPALGKVLLQLTPAHVERRMAERMAAGQSARRVNHWRAALWAAWPWYRRGRPPNQRSARSGAPLAPGRYRRAHPL